LQYGLPWWRRIVGSEKCILVGEYEGKRYLGDLGVDGRVIFVFQTAFNLKRNDGRKILPTFLIYKEIHAYCFLLVLLN
jgi:hypothetical protein